jgi:hypothetical protein
MDLSIFVARVAAVAFIAIAASMFLGNFDYDKLFKELAHSRLSLYIGGLLSLIIGVALVMYHNIWVKDLQVMVTLLGWAALIKGIVLLAFPETITKSKFFKREYKKIAPILVIVLGLLFTYYGFFS